MDNLDTGRVRTSSFRDWLRTCCPSQLWPSQPAGIIPWSLQSKEIYSPVVTLNTANLVLEKITWMQNHSSSTLLSLVHVKSIEFLPVEITVGSCSMTLYLLERNIEHRHHYQTDHSHYHTHLRASSGFVKSLSQPQTISSKVYRCPSNLTALTSQSI